MRRKFIYLFLLFMLFFFCGFRSLKAAGDDVYYIVTNPGADMSTQMNISYHSDVQTTFVQYTKVTDTNWNNAKTVRGVAELFSLPDTLLYKGMTISSQGFTERYHCRVSISDLEPGCEYKYRVGANPAAADDIHYFKTADGTAPFSFLFFTDPQYADASGANVFNNLVHMAMEKDPDIRLSVVAGDFIDRGGKISQWDILFRQSALREMPYAVTPGNHEYYDASSSPKVFNNTYFNAFYNNPGNGAPGVEGSSYYFTYNNVLFVSIDSEAAFMSASYGTGLKEAEKEWFKEVMETNYAQYIIVLMHRSFYGSIYKDVSPGLRADWQGLFDKYGVDLVLTGHDHVYRRTVPVYHGVASDIPYRGTTYLIGGSAGKKFYGKQYEGDNKFIELFDNEFEFKSSICLFQVDGKQLTLTTYGVNGEQLDSAVLPAKRSNASRNFEKESYLDNIVITMKENDPTTAVFYWGNNWYGHVNAATLIDEDGHVIGYDYLDTNKLGNTLEIPGLAKNETYVYTLRVDFKDGTSAERTLSVCTRPDYGIIDSVQIDDSSGVVLMWRAILKNDQVKKFRVTVNDELYNEADPTELSMALPELNPYEQNYITFEAVAEDGVVLFSETVEYGSDIDISIYFDKDLSLEVGAESTVAPITDPADDFDIIYSSSDETVATVDEHGLVKAVGEGTAVISAHLRLRPDVKAELSVTVSAPLAPEPPKKKGCFSGAHILISIGFLGFVAILRRRRFI